MLLLHICDPGVAVMVPVYSLACTSTSSIWITSFCNCCISFRIWLVFSLARQFAAFFVFGRQLTFCLFKIVFLQVVIIKWFVVLPQRASLYYVQRANCFMPCSSRQLLALKSKLSILLWFCGLLCFIQQKQLFSLNL